MGINQSSLDLLRKQHDLTESAAYDIAIEFEWTLYYPRNCRRSATIAAKRGIGFRNYWLYKSHAREYDAIIVFTAAPLIDICGTGGSLPNRFNVSTCVALVLGQLGYSVAKHGNQRI